MVSKGYQFFYYCSFAIYKAIINEYFDELEVQTSDVAAT